MANILVTGANGQLGSELKDLSGDSGHQFYFTDIGELDLTDFEAIEKYFEGKNITHCINCAAYTAVDKAETEIDKAIAINVDAVRNLAEVCALYKTLLIHISTDFVFNGISCRPYIESDRPKPVNVYGQSKYEGEKQAVRENPQTIILRTSWLYSSHGSNFVKTMLKAGEDKEILKVVFDQVGTPTYAADLASAILHIIERSTAWKKSRHGSYGTFHFSNEGVASWYDFAVEIFQLSNKRTRVLPIHTEDYPTPAKRPHYSVLDKTRIKSTFELSIPYWKDSLKTCMRKLGY